jgi:hypothetical protein
VRGGSLAAMDELPDWPAGTVTVLSTGAGEPLALRRESLARLREDPRCAVTILAAGDLALTAIGRAIVAEELERVAVVHVEVERIQDHGQDTFVIDDGVQWRWTDEDAERNDAEVRRALRP